MLGQTLEAEIVRLDGGMLLDIQPVGQPGTTGSVFQAHDGRSGGTLVALKISHDEPSARRALLNEEAVLRVPAIHDYCEPTWPAGKPLARSCLRRVDPINRVGLVLEWLDDTFVPLERIVQESPVLLTELQILRMFTPVAGLLAATHRSGYVYVDIGAQKADHFWWRSARAADGRWAVPLAGGHPQFQLKVIDWANAMKIDEPGYAGDVTPTHDIAGLGEPLFYLAHGPQAPIPNSPTALAGAVSGSLDDIIRRAFFASAPDSFVQEAQRNLTSTQRSQLLRDTQRRAAATEAMFTMMQQRRATLLDQHRTAVAQLVALLEPIEGAGDLPGLQQALADTMVSIYGPARNEVRANPTVQGERLLTALKSRLESLRNLDADDRALPGLAARGAAVEQLLQQRRTLVAARGALTKLRLDEVASGLKTLADIGPSAPLVEEFTLLSSLLAACEEATGTPAGAGLLDVAVMSALVTNILGSPAERRQALDMVLREPRWGSDIAARSLRLLLSSRAGGFLLHDMLAYFSSQAQEQATQLKTEAKRGILAARSTLEDRSKQIVEARQALRAAKALHQFKAGSEADLPPMDQLTGDYNQLVGAAAVLERLGVLSPEDVAPLRDMAAGVPAEVAAVKTALAGGSLVKALTGLTAWQIRDPQNQILEGYARLLEEYRSLDWAELGSRLDKLQPVDLPELLGQLRTKLDAVRERLPGGNYWAVLDNLLTWTGTLAEQAAKDIATSQFGGLAERVLGGLLSALRRLTGEPLGGRRTFTNADSWGRELPRLYFFLRALQPDSLYKLTPGDFWSRIEDQGIQSRLDEMGKIPELNSLSSIMRDELAGIAEDQACTAVSGQYLTMAKSWLRWAAAIAPSGNAAARLPEATSLSEMEKTWNTTGPSAALSSLEDLQGNPRVQDLLIWANARDLLAEYAQVMRGQAEALEYGRRALNAVQAIDPAVAEPQIVEILRHLVVKVTTTDEQLQILGRDTLRRPLAQDLEPMMHTMSTQGWSLQNLEAAATVARPEVQQAVYNSLVDVFTWITQETATNPQDNQVSSTGPPSDLTVPRTADTQQSQLTPTSKPAWQQPLVLAGGVGAVLVLAMLIFFLLNAGGSGGGSLTPTPGGPTATLTVPAARGAVVHTATPPTIPVHALINPAPSSGKPP